MRFRRPRISSLVRLAAITLFALPFRLFAQSPTTTQRPDMVVDLPPFILEEARTKVVWNYLSLPGIEILSRCSSSATEDFGRSVYQLQEIRRAILPDELWLITSTPHILIIVGEDDLAKVNDRVVQEMVRAEQGRTWEEVGKLIGPHLTGRTSVPAPDEGSAPLVRFLPNLRFWDKDTELTFSVLRETTFDAEHLRYTQDSFLFRLHNRAPPLPRWLREGLAAFQAQMEVSPTRINVPPMMWISPRETEIIKKTRSGQGQLLAMEEIFRPPVNDGRPIAQVRRAHDQLVLFLRWVYADRSGKRKAALWKLISETTEPVVSEEQFKKYFGMKFSTAEAFLASYLPGAIIRDLEILPEPKKFPRVDVRSATDSEVARLKGEWERLEYLHVKREQPEFAAEYLQRARKNLERAQRQGDRDPRLLAALGLLESDAGRDAVARPYLTEAASHGIRRPRVYYELARIKLAELTEKEGSDATLLAPTAVDDLTGLLASARKEAPPLPDVYHLLVEILELSPKPLSVADEAALAEGLRLFPDDHDLQMDIAMLRAKNRKIGR